MSLQGSKEDIVVVSVQVHNARAMGCAETLGNKDLGGRHSPPHCSVSQECGEVQQLNTATVADCCQAQLSA
jgi:hypothetical protein